MPNLSFVLPLILQSAVIPVALALAALAVARAMRLSAIGSAVAIAAGFIGAYFAALHAQWSPVPNVALDWLPWIAVAGTAGTVAVERIGSKGLRLAGRLALSLAVSVVMVWPALASLGWSKAASMASATGVVIWTIWNYMAQTANSRPTPPLLLAVVAGGAGLALMLDSSQSIGQLSGALASALIACAAFNLHRVRLAFSPAAAGASVLLLGTLLFNANIYAGFPLAYIALLVSSLIADPVIDGLNRLRRRNSGAASWTAATLLSVIPVAVTVGLAVKAASDAGGY